MSVSPEMVRRIIAATLGEMRRGLMPELRELVHSHQGDAAGAAKDVWENPKKHPHFSYPRVDLKFFQDKLSKETGKTPRDIIEDLEKELKAYVPLTPEGKYPQKEEMTEVFRGAPVPATAPKGLNKNKLFMDFVQLSTQTSRPHDEILYGLVNKAMIAAEYAEVWKTFGAEESPLSKKYVDPSIKMAAAIPKATIYRVIMAYQNAHQQEAVSWQ